ncbi:hypothetical protein SUNI508_10126 [Seiridium unicorne]|uniref:Carboxylic ester hydrolase n=1 Tax=Seiridium unicorne TaxID=138068 RepID=A0ABR2UNF7_9PEZI
MAPGPQTGTNFDPGPQLDPVTADLQDFTESPDHIATGKDSLDQGDYDASLTNLVDTKQPRSPVSSLAMEIGALALALTCLVGLVLLLRQYDQKPPPEWTLGPWGVTLNAVISVISLVFRASLLGAVAQCIGQFCWVWFSTQSRPLNDISYYDGASRGALGSLRLLLRLRFIHFASLGAAITLVATITGPAFQQTVLYQFRPAIDSSEQAYALAANRWGDSIVAGSEFVNACKLMRIIPAGVAHQTLTQSDVITPHDMEAAIRIGIMSSNLLSLPDPPFNCPTGNCTWDPFSTLAIGTKCLDITDSVSLNCSATDIDGCIFAAPNDPLLSAMLEKENSSSIAMVVKTGLADDLITMPEPLFQNLTVLLAMVQWIKASNTAVYVEPASTLEAFRSSDVVFTPPFAKSPPNRNTTFVLPSRAFWSLSSELWHPALLNGDVGISGSNGPISDSDLVLSLYKADNITRAMYTMTKSMTVAIRANRTNILQERENNSQLIAPEEAVNGTVWVQQQFVSVRWGWVAFPAVLIILATIFLVATIMSTRAKHIGFWKTSPLTLLFHMRLPDDEGDFTKPAGWTELENPEVMRKAAADLWGQIPKDDRREIHVYRKAGQPGGHFQPARVQSSRYSGDSLEMDRFWTSMKYGVVRC